MMLLGSTLGAERAVSLGLAHEIVGDAPARALELAGQLAGLGPLALEFAKEAVHRGSELPLRDGLRLEGDLNHQLAATDDRAEGLAAFFDKRPPDFSGR
jgi:enoyl-CoA hydratase/carnithine racemase